MRPAQTLICTVGTSLFSSNLANLRPDDPNPARRALAACYAEGDWIAVAEGLAAIPSTDRLCGAEINSLSSLFAHDAADPKANLFFCHSATTDGRAIAAILRDYYRRAGHAVVEAREIEGLQDVDPKLFRTKGLRNLAKVVCGIIRDRGASSCAINATGGYKAQIATAVLMGQALGVPVYYKHERFDEIIAFPPMPVALNFEVWMRASGMLFALEREGGTGPASLLDDLAGDAEMLESLVERVEIDGQAWIEMSPTGQIFHETFRERFRSSRDPILPPAVPAAQKKPPHIHDGHVFREVRPFLESVTAQVPQVSRCATFYSNLDLAEPTRFRLGAHGIEGVFSNGKATVKFRVEILAQTEGQRAAVIAALNEWWNATRP